MSSMKSQLDKLWKQWLELGYLTPEQMEWLLVNHELPPDPPEPEDEQEPELGPYFPF
jgi:hypothetical protein